MSAETITIVIPDDFAASFQHEGPFVKVCTKGTIPEQAGEVNVVLRLSRQGAMFLSHYLKTHASPAGRKP